MLTMKTKQYIKDLVEERIFPDTADMTHNETYRIVTNDEKMLDTKEESLVSVEKAIVAELIKQLQTYKESL